MKIKLWENDVPGYDPQLGEEPFLTPYLIESDKKHGAVIVCPGGAYKIKATHEGEPIALWLNSIGLSAFVLDYRISPYRHPVPMLDVQRAIRLVRYNAERWNINPDKIGIMGFSAGGHLASTAGTKFDNGDQKAEDPVERVSSRPDAIVLCYPVITFRNDDNAYTMHNLLGDNPTVELRDLLSSEKHVSEETPPAFIWHTSDDEGVSVENSVLFDNALRENKIEFELHIFPNGRHGLGLAQNEPGVSQWTSLCIEWLRKIGFLE